LSVFESITTGLEQAVEYEKGTGKARTKKLAIKPVTDYTATDIKKLRQDMGMSQLAFSQLVGVSQKTVEAWETGTNKAAGSARRIFDIIKADPEIPEKLGIIY